MRIARVKGSRFPSRHAALLVAWFDATGGRYAVRQLYVSRDPDATAAALSGLDAGARQSAVCRWLETATMPPALPPVPSGRTG
jgi:hypothetical protein